MTTLLLRSEWFDEVIAAGHGKYTMAGVSIAYEGVQRIAERAAAAELRRAAAEFAIRSPRDPIGPLLDRANELELAKVRVVTPPPITAASPEGPAGSSDTGPGGPDRSEVPPEVKQARQGPAHGGAR